LSEPAVRAAATSPGAGEALPQALPPGATAELVGGLLRDGKRVSLAVTGFSMAPFLKGGDRVTLEPARRIRTGDVVVRLSGAGRLLVHRVVGGAAAAPLTRGDSANEPDPAIRPGELLGRVQRAERAGRRLWLGLGPERRLLALLSRLGWLRPLLVAARRGRRLGIRAA